MAAFAQVSSLSLGNMDSDRWQQVQELFHECVDLPQGERNAFLQIACADDDAMRSEILSMLEADGENHSILDGNLANIAQQVLAITDSASLEGHELGPYVMKKILGEGGMGVVYLAERKDLRNVVAIKVLRDAWLSPARRERFASEQRMLAQLTHPSIARLYDAHTLSDGTPCFVMEHVEGLPITNYCREHRCSVERRLQLFRQVCEAVQYAHAHAVIHRDLKPSNILVKADGTVRLLDFGIAKQLQAPGSAIDQTRTLLQLMTPAYAAPEQIRGGTVGVQTDVYSLGVILYELLAGNLPFDLSNLTPGEAATITTEHDPGRPSASARKNGNLGNAQWADLDVLCLTAMHRDLQRRYPSVEALLRDIGHYSNGQPLDARGDTFRYRAGKFLGRNWRPVSTSAAVLVAIVTLSVSFMWRLSEARNSAIEEAARTQRIQGFLINAFHGGDEIAGPGSEVRIIDIIDHGVREARAMSSDPRLQADLFYNFASVYQKLGQPDKADSMFRSALEQRQLVFGADSPQVAETLTAIASLRSEQSRLDEADELGRQGFEMSNRHLAKDSPQVIKAIITWGRILGQRGSYDKAISLLEGAVRVQTELIDVPPAELANSLGALAEVNYSAGHYDVCVPLYQRVLNIHRQVYGPQHPLVADDLGSLGAVQQDLGFYREAEDFNRQALELTTRFYGKHSPKTARSLTALGRAMLYQKKYDDAVVQLQRALDIQERAFGPRHSLVADTLNELGNIASMRDQLDLAESYFARVVEIYRSVYGDDHYRVAIALSNVATVRMNRKDYDRAEELYRDVIRRFLRTLPGNNINLGIAHVKLGRTLLRAKRFKEAEVETLAGYEILAQQSSPATSFMHAARKDLVAEYEALNQTAKAEKFRAELASPEDKAASKISKN
jgi:eukaryotic-like serine/threonine-protein kinase